jgi:hypothetical protein
VNSTTKYLQIDNKINEKENSFKDKIEEIDKKFNNLKEQLIKFTKTHEEEKNLKENYKLKNLEELKNFENKVTFLLKEEKKVRNYYL